MKTMNEFRPIPLHGVNADAKINAVLGTVQGRCKARIISVADIRDAIAKIEKHFGIPKCKMNGLLLDCDINAQGFPIEYKFVPKSTIFTVENRKGKWYLDEIRRDITFPPTRAVQVRFMNDVTADAILWHHMRFEI